MMRYSTHECGWFVVRCNVVIELLHEAAAVEPKHMHDGVGWFAYRSLELLHGGLIEARRNSGSRFDEVKSLTNGCEQIVETINDRTDRCSRQEPRGRSGGHVSPFLVAIVDPDAPTPQSPTVLHFMGGGYRPDDATQYLWRRSHPRMRSPGHENLKLMNDRPAIIEFLQPQPPIGKNLTTRSREY